MYFRPLRNGTDNMRERRWLSRIQIGDLGYGHVCMSLFMFCIALTVAQQLWSTVFRHYVVRGLENCFNFGDGVERCDAVFRWRESFRRNLLLSSLEHMVESALSSKTLVACQPTKIYGVLFQIFLILIPSWKWRLFSFMEYRQHTKHLIQNLPRKKIEPTT